MNKITLIKNYLFRKMKKNKAPWDKVVEYPVSHLHLIDVVFYKKGKVVKEVRVDALNLFDLDNFMGKTYPELFYGLVRKEWN